jgi:ribosomal protein S27E
MHTQPPKTDANDQLRAQPHDGERAAIVMDAEGREMPCPVCGAEMPDLKGGKASICLVCGFKDSCCY